MTHTHHARKPKKTPRRHAGDVIFHLDNALRSIHAVMNQARDRQAFEEAQRLEDRLREARDAALGLRGTFAQLQAQHDNARRRAA